MIRKLVFLCLMVTLLFGCAQVDSSPAIKVNDLLGSIDNTKLNTLRIVEFSENYTVVEFNGMRYRVTRDSKYLENEARIINFAEGLSDPAFFVYDLFNERDWVLQSNVNPSLEYYVFRDYPQAAPMDSTFDPTSESALAIVLVAKDKMPKVVEYKAWLGTEAKIWIWNYPNRFPWMLQNMTTGEVAFLRGTVISSIDGSEEYLPAGMIAYGILSEKRDLNDMPVLVINK